MKLRRERVHVWHVEMFADDYAANPRKQRPGPAYELKQVSTPLPELNRFLYATVGAPWNWYMRLNWDYHQWQSYLAQDGIETWIAYQDANPVGYFELDRVAHDHNSAPDTVEIAYFGLLPAFIGKGFGSRLLEDALQIAFADGVSRVWLHTCSLDHPHALTNYLARGFAVFREEDMMDQIPDEPLQPWPGAAKPATDH